MNKTLLTISLGLILILAFAVRTLPYATGYENLIMGDTIREYEQVLYILENEEINFGFIYGMYPAIHLLVAESSLLTSIDPNILFRFLPQFFAALACIAFFLLMKEAFNEKIALISSFLLAVFGPNLLWAMKPVRETLGLFIFPLILFLYWKAEQEDKYLIPLVLVSILALFVHHWSLLLLLIFVGVFLLFSQNRKILFIYLATVVSAFVYFYLSLNVLKNIFQSLGALLIALAFFAFIYIILSNICYKAFPIEKFKRNIVKYLTTAKEGNNLWTLITICVSLLFIIFLIIKEYLVYDYSLFFLSSIIILLIFTLLGIMPSLEDYPLESLGLIIVATIYFFMVIFGLVTEYQYFDPGRIAEFIIFPLGIFAAMGIIHLVNYARDLRVRFSLLTLLFLFFFISGLFAIPEVYITEAEVDVRSYLQYVPTMGTEAIEWAYEGGSLLVTDNNYVMAIYDLLQYQEEQETNSYLAYVSLVDIEAAEENEQINVKGIGSEIDPEHLTLILSNDKIYTNGWASLYKISKEEYELLYAESHYKWFWGGKK